MYLTEKPQNPTKLSKESCRFVIFSPDIVLTKSANRSSQINILGTYETSVPASYKFVKKYYAVQTRLITNLF